MDGGGLSLTGRRASPGRSPDLVLFGTTLALLVIGIVTVFSASYTTGLREFGDPYYYVKRQILWAALGVIALVIVMHVDYRVWRRWSVAGLLSRRASSWDSFSPSVPKREAAAGGFGSARSACSPPNWRSWPSSTFPRPTSQPKGE